MFYKLVVLDNNICAKVLWADHYLEDSKPTIPHSSVVSNYVINSQISPESICKVEVNRHQGTIGNPLETAGFCLRDIVGVGCDMTTNSQIFLKWNSKGEKIGHVRQGIAS